MGRPPPGRRLTVLLLAATPFLPGRAFGEGPPAADVLRGSREYTFSSWLEGLRDARKVFAVRTSRYALAFDVAAFRLTHLTPIATPVPAEQVLLQDAATAFGSADAGLVCALEAGGRTFRVTGASADYRDCHLIESGRFFQRREVTKLRWEPGTPPVRASLEVAAWPDRLALVLHVRPERTVTGGALQVTLRCGRELGVAAEPPEATITRDPATGAWTERLAVGNWPADREVTLALVVRAAPDPDEGRPVVRARQTAPTAADLGVIYDRTLGWHEVRLRNDAVAGGVEEQNRRLERVRLVIDNPSAGPRVVRLNFAKGRPWDNDVFGITGISPVLRDAAGDPLGIPIQVSKNWHRDPARPDRHEGPWYRGLTMVTVPGHARVELEYVCANALWGGVPAASQAQLCLVGWGDHQLWEQAALGAWGESLCFEPEQGQRGAAVLDTRPLMVWGLGPEPRRRWSWTCNVGGADFVGYYDAAGVKQGPAAVRAWRWRSGPVLTETTYAGRSRDGRIDWRYTVSLYRTDDLTRGVYHFRYDVRRPTEFRRLVLFQCGADDYSYTGERKFAWGNEGGLVREWPTRWGGNVYRTEPFELTGGVPWLSMHEAVPRAKGREAWANRGLVIRTWQARLGGKPARPWAAERGARVRGRDTSLIDLVPPPDVRRLEAGDFVEGTIEHVVVPQSAGDYYGPNDALRAALGRHANTGHMIDREARGNDLAVDVRVGRLVRCRPTRIEASGDRAAFTLAGGVGYVPVTIAGLHDYRGPVLEVNEGGAWKAVNQSVHGRDFWQTDYDAATGTWEVSYSVPADRPGDQRRARDYRFHLDNPRADR